MKTNTPKLFLLISITFLFFGCATPQRPATRSGKPEVTINSDDREMIKSIIVGEFLDSGYTLISDTDYNIVFSKSMEGFGGVMYQAMLGNSYSSTPEWNARINIITTSGSTRVIAQAVVKMQNAFGREDVNDMTNGKAGVQLQALLNRVKTKCES